MVMQTVRTSGVEPQRMRRRIDGFPGKAIVEAYTDRRIHNYSPEMLSFERPVTGS